MTSISTLIKLLANDIHPHTGEVLAEDSLVHRADVIRTLFALSEERADIDRPRARKPKLSAEERRQKNVAEGRPAKSHFPWDEDEKTRLAAEREAGKTLTEPSGLCGFVSGVIEDRAAVRGQSSCELHTFTDLWEFRAGQWLWVQSHESGAKPANCSF